MTEPRTQAGRDLLALHANCQPMTACTMHGDLPAAILAIEAEALPSVERLARALRKADPKTEGGYYLVTVEGLHAALRDEP